ncbi:MAG: hypothetical protein V4592_21995 [Bacteroidota bacterium]
MDARTEKIVNSFQSSWLETLAWYNEHIDNYPAWERYIPVKKLIEDFIKNGEDRFFYAKTSHSTLLVSRSVDGGLREDQKFVSIDVINPGVFEIKLREPLKTYREFRIGSLDDPRLLKVLKTLKETLVD